MLPAQSQVDCQVTLDAPIVLHIDGIVVGFCRAVCIQVITAATGKSKEKRRHVTTEWLRGGGAGGAGNPIGIERKSTVRIAVRVSALTVVAEVNAGLYRVVS